jgi:hypothetical protein
MFFGGTYDTVHRWVRRTSTWFEDLRPMPHVAEGPAPAVGDGLVYKLRQWPDLPSVHRTAAVYRALSVMSNRRVNRRWFVKHSRMKAPHAERLLDTLIRQGAIEIVDVSGFPAQH